MTQPSPASPRDNNAENDSLSQPPNYIRTETGYRVAGVYELGGPIAIFDDTPEGRERAIQLAKSLCRDQRQRAQLYDAGRVSDENFITIVERFTTHVELLGLFSPQDNPEYSRFGHFPGNDDNALIDGVLRTKGKWSCLNIPDGATDLTDVREQIRRLEPLVQSLETEVCTEAAKVDLVPLQERMFDDENFARLYEAGQNRGDRHTPDDFIRGLLTIPELDADFASEVAHPLYAAQELITAAVADAAARLQAQLPEPQRAPARADLRAFIYEVLLSRFCRDANVE